MGGGGSHGSGEVTYHEAILSRWGAHYDHVSDEVVNVYDSRPRKVSWWSEDDNWGTNGNSSNPGATSFWDINPEWWYGNITEMTKAAAALTAYKALSPATLFTTYADPSSGVKIESQRIGTLRAWLDSLWQQLGDAAGIEATKAAMINAFATRMADRIETEVIPKLEVGMRNTNSVLSSAILMAKSAIWEGYNQEVSDYSAKIDFQVLDKQYGLMEALARLEPMMMQTTTQSYDLALRRVESTMNHARLSLATNISLLDDWWTKYSKAKTILTEDEIRDSTWNAEAHDYLNKALAALPGASVVGKNGSINAAASSLSGAASGAAAGAMIGTSTGIGVGWGTAIGAVVGGIAGYLQSQ